MRNIKFRGKHVESGEWIVGWLFQDDDDHFPMIHQGGTLDDWEQVKEETIGQFTGLTDKKGIDIYEGDIILVRGTYHRVVLWDKISFALMPCEFYHDKTFWAMSLQHPGEDWWELFADDIEIVGNIFDNKELIE